MKVFLRIINSLKWLGLVGVLGRLLNIRSLEFFWFFFLLFFVDFIFNLRFNLQCLKQLITLPAAPIRYGSKLPTKDSYSCKGDYILPFKGEWSVVNGGVHKEISHSWSIPSQRYAYDFLIIDEKGKTYNGDLHKPEDYYCYGKEIIAPEDGTVVYIYDKCEDSRIYGNGKLDTNIKDICGNQLVIKHYDNEYSMIAHIMPNSIVVKVGQNVKKGDFLARCGNTGNSSEPHIHFQLMTGKSHFTAAGLPIVFNQISIKESEAYQILDRRPIPTAAKEEDKQGENIASAYIRRGQYVRNSEWQQKK